MIANAISSICIPNQSKELQKLNKENKYQELQETDFVVYPAQMRKSESKGEGFSD